MNTRELPEQSAIMVWGEGASPAAAVEAGRWHLRDLDAVEWDDIALDELGLTARRAWWGTDAQGRESFIQRGHKGAIEAFVCGLPGNSFPGR